MTTAVPFGARFEAAVAERGQVCVGIDPHTELFEAWGLPRSPDGLARFADICVTAFAGTAAVVKPQSAFFEVFGAAGVAVLERTVAACRSAGALVLLDVKRGDIGTTMAAYAQAYLDPASPLGADAITLSPYLGVGSLQPAFDRVEQHGAGVFVLAATSNPEGSQVQHARDADGRTTAQLLVDELVARNGGRKPGSYGIVAGATIAPGTLRLDDFTAPILAPGVGAQGGTPDSVRQVFGDALPYVLPSVSREVLRQGPDPVALRTAVARLAEDFGFLRG